MDDKQALRMSSAGMRLIALVTIFNGEDPERLRQFVSESYDQNLLEAESIPERLEAFLAVRGKAGKLRVQQVIGVSKEHVIVLLVAQQGEEYLVDLQVGADYPHAITGITLSRVVHDDDGE